jgi:hypothetical protein
VSTPSWLFDAYRTFYAGLTEVEVLLGTLTAVVLVLTVAVIMHVTRHWNDE